MQSEVGARSEQELARRHESVDHRVGDRLAAPLVRLHERRDDVDELLLDFTGEHPAARVLVVDTLRREEQEKREGKQRGESSLEEGPA